MSSTTGGSPQEGGSRKKALILRLNAMGDIVLATSALPELLRNGYEIHWVTFAQWAPLLRQDERIHTVHSFDKGSGLRGWIWMVRHLLCAHRFSIVVDLHSSLRTRLARSVAFLQFPFLALFRWKRLRKPRFRLWGLFFAKKRWPGFFDPPSKWRANVWRVSGDLDEDRPKLQITAPKIDPTSIPIEGDAEAKPVQRPRWALMPSSKWRPKEVDLNVWLQFLKPYRKTHEFLILGLEGDSLSLELAQALVQQGAAVRSGVGKLSLSALPTWLQACQRCVSVDTGVAHLAEALGVPVTVFFGPTDPRMGFGPWRAESASIVSQVWCRPCSKDGRACYYRGSLKENQCAGLPAFEHQLGLEGKAE